MRWRRIFGVFLLLAGLLLAVLMSAKVPFVKTNILPVENPVEVPANGDAFSFYNATLEPLGKENYQVRVTISSYDKPVLVDFWAVNTSGLGILDTTLGMGTLFMNEYYANERPFSNIKVYAREINITIEREFNLVHLDHNGTYNFVLINFFENPQNVSVSIQEQYVDSFRPILEPNIANIAVTGVVFAGSIYLIVTGGTRPARRMKKQARKT